MVASRLRARAELARRTAMLGLLMGAACANSDSPEPTGSGGVSGTSAGGSGGGMPADGGSGGTPSSTGGVGGSAPLLDAGADSENVVPDPSFESDASGWLAWLRHRLERTQAGPRSGAWCLVASGRTEAWMGPSLVLTDRVTPGGLYDVSLWVRVGSAASPVSMTLKFLCRERNDDLSTSQFLPVAGPAIATNVWSQLTGSLQIPVCEAPKVLQDLRLIVEGAPADVDVYLDDVRVVPSAP